jgi:MFS family permease
MGFPFSGVGLWMRNTTNAYQVYNLTDSETLLGLTFLFQGLPMIIVGLFGGTLADFLPKRTVIRTTMSLEVCLAVLLATLTLSGSIEVWHIYVITFTSASLAACEHPARSALLPKLVPRHLLLNATTLISFGFSSAMLLGPVLGGVLIDTAGPGWSYVINAFLIVPGIIAITLLKVADEGQRAKLRLNLATLFEGLIFVIRTRILIIMVLLDVVTMIFGYYPALMPVFAKDVLGVGGTGLGALLAASPLGALLGLMVLLALGNLERKGLVLIGVTIVHGVVLIAFAASPWFGLSLVLIALLGLVDSISVSVRQTSFQLVAKDENRGRVASLVGLVAQSSNSLGGAYLGLAAALMGPQLSLTIGGAIGAGFAIVMAISYPKLRRFKA